jgi:hypothetical protein
VHAARYPHVPRVTAHAHPWDERADFGGRHVVATDAATIGRPLATRDDLDLQLGGKRLRSFALANFNQLYKLDPDSLSAWGNALRRLAHRKVGLVARIMRREPSRHASPWLTHLGPRSGPGCRPPRCGSRA